MCTKKKKKRSFERGAKPPIRCLSNLHSGQKHNYVAGRVQIAVFAGHVVVFIREGGKHSARLRWGFSARNDLKCDRRTYALFPQPWPEEYCRTHRHPTKPFVRTRRDFEGRREFWFCFLVLRIISTAYVLARNRRRADRGHTYPCRRDFRRNHTANNTFCTRQNLTAVTGYIWLNRQR